MGVFNSVDSSQTAIIVGVSNRGPRTYSEPIAGPERGLPSQGETDQEL